MPNNKEFPEDFYQYLKENTLIKIKGGKTRNTFLKIWMVTIKNRVFARSWNKSKNSWFTEFQKLGYGEIKYGSKIIDVKAQKLKKEDKLNDMIDKAYLDKYTQAKNSEYVKGITQAEYADYTMEFFI